jgi:hypothetical protein
MRIARLINNDADTRVAVRGRLAIIFEEIFNDEV